METKTCPCCREEMPLTQDFFHLRGSYRGRPCTWINQCKQCRQCRQAYVRRHNLVSRANQNAIKARRRARRLQATPSWLTPEHHSQIAAKYLLAAQLTSETGILHVVDHIAPLQGKTLCGLHVPWNLRVLTQQANASKYNQWIPKEGDCIL